MGWVSDRLYEHGPHLLKELQNELNHDIREFNALPHKFRLDSDKRVRTFKLRTETNPLCVKI